jgi:putative DNA methylase
MSGDDRRLIEDLIPVAVVSEMSSREKQGARLGHPSSLHQWWARRPLAAARAAAYATLTRVADTPDEARSAEYFTELCRWGANEERIADARERVLAANGGRPPRVLDMFAGGGAIPLEAARLGCEATAVELNPVAHLIELCMLDYPQRFGPSLAGDVRKWGERWVAKAWDRVGHLYPPVEGEPSGGGQLGLEGDGGIDGERRPIAYLWTRTVRCPNHQLGEHRIPLVRQTWLARKKNRYIALRPVVDRERLTVSWDPVEVADRDELGFDPSGFSNEGRATCFVCGASVDGKYVKREGMAGRIEVDPLAAVLRHPSGRGREFRAPGSYELPDEDECAAVLDELDVEPPTEQLPVKLTGGMCTAYGLTRFCDLFSPRQQATLCSLAQGVAEIHGEMVSAGVEAERARAVAAHLALVLDRTSDLHSTLCRWVAKGEFTANTFAKQALPMTWDFSETNPFGGASGDLLRNVERAALVIEHVGNVPERCAVHRTSATQLPSEDEAYDAIITDPPYYDNISYSDLSDFFYVWLKRSVGFLFPEHLAGELTPKQREMIVAPYRHDGGKDAAREFYEHEMEAAFREAHRVLKPNAPLVCVYAHKTTLGWASLVEALRRAGFTITEAWPLDTEMPERSVGQGTASLASSIFLVARRREGEQVGDHNEVMRDLDSVIGERLDRLTEAGVAGSDLIIATIGAGLRPFTEYERVQLPNGEEVPAKDFLDQVQSRVLNAVLAKVHGLADGVGTIDSRTRFYVISRYSFGYRKVEFDEANNLAHSAGIELADLAEGPRPLLRISKDKVSFLDYTERGEDAELGLAPDGAEVALIDVLHGLLWRAGRHREEVGDYLVQANFDPTALRLVAQALQGKGLREEGESKPDEAQACERLLGAWKTLVNENLMTAR